MWLAKKYSEDPEFALQLRMLAALAFAPKDDVISSYSVLIESNYYKENEEILENFLDYFENKCLGKLDRLRRRKQPKIEIEMWNCFLRIEQDIATTNNSVEGWHNCFTSILSGKHPSIWRFIEALKKEESINRLKIEQYKSGIEPQKKKYQDRVKRIKTICTVFNDLFILDYLRGIAYNFQLQIKFLILIDFIF